MKKSLLVLAILALTTGIVSAFDTTALQLGIWAPNVQLVPPEISITGVKINLPYGSNCQITGLDIGLVSISNDQGTEL